MSDAGGNGFTTRRFLAVSGLAGYGLARIPYRYANAVF